MQLTAETDLMGLATTQYGGWYTQAFSKIWQNRAASYKSTYRPKVAELDKTSSQILVLAIKKSECEELIANSPPPDTKSPDLFCPIIWDGIYCWPYAKAGSVVEIECPSYIVGFNSSGRASKWCTQNAMWYSRDSSINGNITSTWSNYSDCYPFSNEVERIHNGTIIEEYIPIVKTISKVGYSISFITLLVAFTILAIIKRLRCPRNNLHMHLFASFMLRALMTLLKNNLFIAGIGLPSNVIFAEGKPLYFNEDEKWDCKLLITFWQYFLMANYIWILMEGLYLHNLIFMAMFSDSSGIILYIILGWTIPILFIIPWAIARASYENTLCWTTHNNDAIFWIIRAPITVSIVINFFFFLNITRMLFIKMRTSYNPSARKRRYNMQDFRKLARSTLVLVPLFGVHYTIFLGMSTKAGVDEVTEIVWLLCDQFFSAFQGFFVAVLYCFMNGEVQSEIRKKWQRWNLSHGQISNSRSSIATQSLTCINSKPRNSLHSITTVLVKRKDRKLPSSSSFPKGGHHSDQGSLSPSMIGERRMEGSPVTNWSYTTKISDSSINADNSCLIVTCSSSNDCCFDSNYLAPNGTQTSSTGQMDRLSLPFSPYSCTVLELSVSSDDSKTIQSPLTEISNVMEESSF